MTLEEYNEMCDKIEEKAYESISENDRKKELKRLRSGVLTRMQKLGIDTTSWPIIDGFLLDPKITGKKFSLLTIEDLRALIPKLESILNKPKSTRHVDTRELLELPTYKLN